MSETIAAVWLETLHDGGATIANPIKKWGCNLKIYDKLIPDQVS